MPPTTAQSPTELEESQRLQLQTHADAYNRMVQMINGVAETDQGRAFLEWLAAHCGFPHTPVMMRADQGGVVPLMETTLYNSAILGVYLNIRKYLRPVNRHRVEDNL